MIILPRRRVGRTKLEVTTLGLGGAPMGGFRARITDAEAVTLTDAAYAGGVRYFDTSPFYGYGRSELRMGAALREKPRDSYVLSTKIGRIMHAMKPGEKPPADFRDNGLPGFETRRFPRTHPSRGRAPFKKNVGDHSSFGAEHSVNPRWTDQQWF